MSSVLHYNFPEIINSQASYSYHVYSFQAYHAWYFDGRSRYCAIYTLRSNMGERCKPTSASICYHILNFLQTMHAGVVRDMERQRIKKERQLDFDMQRELEEEYRKVQNVSDVGNRSDTSNS